MTSPERVYSVCKAVEYVARNRIAGSLVECGVWRGGSMMAAAMTLVRLGDTSRDLYLFDTFAGMTEPTSYDETFDGVDARTAWQQESGGAPLNAWCHATLEDVVANLSSTGYPRARLNFVQGPVEETLPSRAPDRISLLRLDTDWYESTRHELEHLYPRLERGGVLIVDDYGHWKGARKAVDEYLESLPTVPLLARIDFTGRMAIKP
jgi:hypothetical protein